MEHDRIDLGIARIELPLHSEMAENSGDLTPEDKIMAAHLETLYPNLAGSIRTQEDLQRVLSDLRGEDD